MADITQESSEEVWTQLRTQWEREARPGYLTRGNVQYLVIRGEDGLKFRVDTRENMMNKTSLGR
jgi:hypothetical protein